MTIEFELTTNHFTAEEVSLFKTTPLSIQFIEKITVLLIMGVVEVPVAQSTEFKYALAEVEKANELSLGVSINYNDKNVVERYKDQPMDAKYFCYNYVMTLFTNTVGRAKEYESLAEELVNSFALPLDNTDEDLLVERFVRRVGHVHTYYDFAGLYIENSLTGDNLQVPELDFKSINKEQLVALFGAVAAAPYVQ